MSLYDDDERVTPDADGTYLVFTGKGLFRVCHAEADAWETFPVNNAPGNYLMAGSADDAIACLIGAPKR